MFGAFTEGMSLFASFAMLLNFPRHNKMNGMGQIVSWSVRDESLHCEGITKLYHAWNDETGAVTKAVRDDIIDVANTMVGLEEGFVDLAFGLGEVQGMTPAAIKFYVRYIADWRLTQLKLPPVFGNFEATESGYTQIKPHPLPWLVEILNGVEHANFFEQRATEYSKGAKWQLGWREGVWSQFDKRNQLAAESDRGAREPTLLTDLRKRSNAARLGARPSAAHIFYELSNRFRNCEAMPGATGDIAPVFLGGVLDDGLNGRS